MDHLEQEDKTSIILNEYDIIDDKCVVEKPATTTIEKNSTRKGMVRRYSCSESSTHEQSSSAEGNKSICKNTVVEERSMVKYPAVNCPEKIIICIDLSSEMNNFLFKSRAGDKFSPMKLIKRALGIFLQTKSKINSSHEYAVVALHGDAAWGRGFTSDHKEIISYLDDLCTTKGTYPCDDFDVGSLFDVIADHVTLPVVNDPSIPPPYTIRALLFYGRSHCVPHFNSKEAFKLLNSSPYFFTDAFYVHEPPGDENKCEDVYNFLCDLDVRDQSYIFEVSRNLTRVYDHISQFLAHPLQRPFQKDLYFKISSRET